MTWACFSAKEAEREEVAEAIVMLEYGMAGVGWDGTEKKGRKWERRKKAVLHLTLDRTPIVAPGHNSCTCLTDAILSVLLSRCNREAVPTSGQRG